MSSNSSGFRRDNVEIDGEEYRMYGPEDGELQWFSVSEILNSRPTPDKDAGIQGWKDWLRSDPDKPNPEDVKRYKTSRGTLAHYKALRDLASYDLRGDEEREAYHSLRGWEYGHMDALSTATDEIEWFVDEWIDMAEDCGIAKYNDDDDLVDHNALEVEKYVADEEYGYAGQFDLMYEAPDGDTVVADLKSSKASTESKLINKKFPRYGMQLAAYARAVDADVDRCDVIWISPDTSASAVIPDTHWPKTRSEYEDDFLDLCEDFRDAETLTVYEE